jgi:hypothetical protein
MNLLSQRLSQAAKDADELLRESDETSVYLRDREGAFEVDPVVPEDRAAALYEALMSAEDQRLVTAAEFSSVYQELDDELDLDSYLGDELEDTSFQGGCFSCESDCWRCE